MTLSLPVDVNAIAAGDILELDVTLTFSRNPLLVDPAVAALQGGTGVAAAILPRADGDGNVSYTVFSKAVEAIFATADWYLKVGQGLSRDGEDAADGAQQLWAVRFGKAAGQGIHFKLGTSPSYFAPQPIAKALASGDATITRYDSGDTDTLHLDGVDLNQWFQSALDAIDQFLSADYAPHAFILDRIDGVTDPLKDGSLGSVLSTKESLADTISLKTLPVLSTSAGDPSTGFAASEKLRQQLLNQLGAAYRAGAAVVFGLTEVTGGGDSNPAGPPNLYGQPRGSIKGAADNQNFTLTPTRIPLGEVYDPGSKTWYDPRLAFVFATKNVVDQAYVPLELTLSLSHLEFERRTVPGIDGYVASRWLAFVNGPFSYPLGGGQVANIPVVNRDLPTPPTVSAQQARQLTGEGATDPSKLSAWSYSFDYLYQQAAADAVSCTMEFNRPTAPTLRGSARAERRAGPVHRACAVRHQLSGDPARSQPVSGRHRWRRAGSGDARRRAQGDRRLRAGDEADRGCLCARGGWSGQAHGGARSCDREVSVDARRHQRRPRAYQSRQHHHRWDRGELECGGQHDLERHHHASGTRDRDCARTLYAPGRASGRAARRRADRLRLCASGRRQDGLSR
ncbi:hypothetical protein ACRAVF_24030 [Bradyrhizobium oligotrophicum S58]